jgi:hypothetical protein
MSKRKRQFSRPYVERPYRKLLIIAVEGKKTEKGYFDIFRTMQSLMIYIECLNSKTDSSPLHVLERMKRHLADKELKKTDEAWLVVDKDQWTDDQLKTLCGWAQTRDNYGFALSNPKFEYWLLLHFEDGDGIRSPTDCDNRLKQHIPDYAKKIPPHKFTRERIEAAVARAKRRDNPPCQDWPHNPGGTTVYRLVEKILNLCHTL